MWTRSRVIHPPLRRSSLVPQLHCHFRHPIGKTKAACAAGSSLRKLRTENWENTAGREFYSFAHIHFVHFPWTRTTYFKIIKSVVAIHVGVMTERPSREIRTNLIPGRRTDSGSLPRIRNESYSAVISLSKNKPPS